MIETKVEVSKDLEQALKVLQQAKQRVANEKKKEMLMLLLLDGYAAQTMCLPIMSAVLRPWRDHPGRSQPAGCGVCQIALDLTL